MGKIKVPKVLDVLDKEKTIELYNILAEEDKVQALQQKIATCVNDADINALPTLLALSRSYKSALGKMMREMASIHKSMMEQEDDKIDDEPGAFIMFYMLMYTLHKTHISINEFYHKTTQEIYQKTDDTFDEVIAGCLQEEVGLFMKRSTEIYNKWVPGFKATNESKEEKSNDV